MADKSLEALSLGLFFLLLRSFRQRRPRRLSSKFSPILIGTRTSALALWQANLVMEKVRAANPALSCQLIGLNTQGDVDQLKPLSEFGSKGVFTKELDRALLDGRIDMAVHCMKDLPTELPEGIQLSAALERGELCDAVVLHPTKFLGRPIVSLADLPAGAVIGTSAIRRKAQLHRLYPHLRCEEIRGNVNTRLRKLDSGDYDAIILAAVGLERLGMSERISFTLPVEDFGYAVGQGALAVLTRANDSFTDSLVSSLNDAPTLWACEAERELIKILQGGCKVPISVKLTVRNGVLESFWAAVSSPNGEKFLERRLEAGPTPIASVAAARRWGAQLAQTLKESGAEEILKLVR